MNRTERALFELRADMARNPGDLEKAELDYLLASLSDESDRNLAASAELLGLDLEVLEERAAILQYGAGTSRIAANRLALTEALRRLMPDVSDALARWFSQNAAAVMDYAREHGLSREETADELRRYFRRNFGGDTDNAESLLERAG